MTDINFGHIHIKLSDLMKKQGISISKLAFRSETQRTQLKAYIRNDIQRVDLAVLARLCYALECSLDDLVEYIPPQDTHHS